MACQEHMQDLVRGGGTTNCAHTAARTEDRGEERHGKCRQINLVIWEAVVEDVDAEALNRHTSLSQGEGDGEGEGERVHAGPVRVRGHSDGLRERDGRSV